ncbi:hypothetical protein DFO46_0741 [Rhizobium sp. AG855]|nr:hypothetical protein DFO46_0741 [Rhizobium sp. AG855]
MRIVALAGAAVMLIPAISAAQSFSCRGGDRPACLGIFDKVVPQDAQCFNAYTCDYNGFMCSSDHKDYVKKAVKMAEGYDEFKTCVARSSTMNEVQSCVLRDNLR